MPATNNKSVFAVVLAAGSATRFGSTKQLAELNGTAMVRRACELAASVCGARHVLVAGHEWQAVVEACSPMNGFFLVNEQYSEGIGTSLAAAARVIGHAADALIVLLADQPRISAAHLQALIAAWRGGANEIVASAYAGTLGAPALFARGTFDKLFTLRGDQGARALFGDSRFSLRSIEYDAAAVDIDTVADLASLGHSVRS